MVIKKETIIVSFSGGRTSAYMCWWLLSFMNHLYNFIFVFANTGLEKEETLIFVDKCDKYFNLNLIWIEAVVKNGRGKKGDGTTHKIVNFKTASRNGDPMREVIRKYGLPNRTYIHCTRETKLQPIRSLQIELGLPEARNAVGIRGDEFHRVKNNPMIIYPLATIANVKKEEILDFWKSMPFDLQLEEHQGNCKGCYKKSDKKLKLIADTEPNDFDFWIEMENLYSDYTTKEETEKRVIFRNYRTAFEVKNNIKLPKNLSELDECPEECGTIISDYTPMEIKETTLLDYIKE